MNKLKGLRRKARQNEDNNFNNKNKILRPYYRFVFIYEYVRNAPMNV